MIKPNPYRPGAGVAPMHLAGREETIEDVKQILASVSVGYAARSVIYYGLRGVGKTVLLNSIEDMTDERDIPVEYMEIAERNNSFQEQLVLHVDKIIRKVSLAKQIEGYVKKALSVLKSFSITYSAGANMIEIKSDVAIGKADTGNLSNDMTEVFLALGKLLQAKGEGVVICIDEIQYMRDNELEALMEALHRVNQKGYPLVIFAAGLPKIAKIAGDVKSYAERLFQFVEIGSLSYEAARDALVKPAELLSVTYTEEAVQSVLAETSGYPYFIQEYGKCIWDIYSGTDEITGEMVKASKKHFITNLDESFFKVRHDRATQKELSFMMSMVACGQLPCSTGEVAERMGESMQSISPLRAQLIHKGFIYAADRGRIDFTVPKFGDYLKRIHGDTDAQVKK
ncbi:MAG: ATP-binding protein [Veillonellaceae bacterium]|nr:ATP-binding protein [Veillonellaceae bacterium]